MLRRSGTSGAPVQFLRTSRGVDRNSATVLFLDMLSRSHLWQTKSISAGISFSHFCPTTEWARLPPHPVRADMPPRQIVCASDDGLMHVHFPTTFILLLLYVMEGGACAGITIAGNKSVVGVALFMDGETTRGNSVAQSVGKAYRLDARILQDEFLRAGAASAAVLYPAR